MASLLYVAIIPACLISYSLRKKNLNKYQNNQNEDIINKEKEDQ